MLGLLKRIAPRPVRRWIWNREFARGQWTALNHTAGDSLYPILLPYLRGGASLDVGCGTILVLR
jgi:hypothetical protein